VPAGILLVQSVVVPPTQPREQNDAIFSFDLADFAFALLFFVAEIAFATAWHKLVLEREARSAGRLSLGQAEWIYFKKLVMLFFIILLTGLAWVLAMSSLTSLGLGMGGLVGGDEGFNAAGIAVLAIGIAAAVYVAYRYGAFFLVLPAAAVGRNFLLREATHRIGPNRWTLLMTYVCAYLPILLLDILRSRIPLDLSGSTTGFLLPFIGNLPELIFMPVIVGVLSITYRELVQRPEQAALPHVFS